MARGTGVKPAWLAALMLSACAAGEPGGIHDVQGDGDVSPYRDREVLLAPVVVTAVAPHGFFVGSLPGAEDGDPSTSEGLYVHTGHEPDLEAGQRLRLRGRVIEYHGHTQLTDTEWAADGTASTPEPVALSGAPAEGWESVESMRVAVAHGVVAAPSDRHGEALAVPSAPRPFRKPGSVRGSGRLFELDPDGMGEADRLLIAGSRFRATGPMVFRHGDYVLWPESLALWDVPGRPASVREAEPDELALASFNLRLFRDDVSDHGESRLPAAAYQARLVKLSGWLFGVLRCPAVVAVQEVEDGEVLERIARESRCGYRAVGATRRDGPELGYLVDEDAVVLETRELGVERRLDGDGSRLFDRPPLLLRIRVAGNDSTLTLVNVHLRSMIGLDDEPRVRRKRLQQAEVLRELLEAETQDNGSRLVVLGDFNAFPFSDGIVDVLGRITGGRPIEDGFDVPRERRSLLHKLDGMIDEGERYSLIHEGRAQLLDQVLVSPSLRERVTLVTAVHGNADAPAALAHQRDTLLRVSDHDPLVVYIKPDG